MVISYLINWSSLLVHEHLSSWLKSDYSHIFESSYYLSQLYVNSFRARVPLREVTHP